MYVRRAKVMGSSDHAEIWVPCSVLGREMSEIAPNLSGSEHVPTINAVRRQSSEVSTMRVRVADAVLTACLVLALTCLFERPAYAYIDPGSGILACQAISAFCAGALFYFRRSVRNLIRSFHVPEMSSKDQIQIDRSGH
jgi:hypothetical protein